MNVSSTYGISIDEASRKLITGVPLRDVVTLVQHVPLARRSVCVATVVDFKTMLATKAEHSDLVLDFASDQQPVVFFSDLVLVLDFVFFLHASNLLLA